MQIPPTAPQFLWVYPEGRGWEYAFDALGNLTMRRDDKRNSLEETFEYDELNRLKFVYKNNTQTLAMTYDELGNILTKSDVGAYEYDPQRPHAVKYITPYQGGIFKSTSQNIHYSSFDKVSSIRQGADSLYIAYGSAYERIYADSYQNNILTKRRTYVGRLYEQEKEQATGKVKEKFYIFGGDGLVAVQITDDTGSKLSYVHKDHLGSMQCLTNDADALEQELSFDAWGNRRNPDTWEVYTTAPTGLILDRGFTGHEHIDLFDLVNMDGRVYDPVIGRFLSPDPVIQDPENLQSLNRYSYCLNNPLSLVDPSGYSWLSKNWRSLVTAAVAITVSVVTLGGATALGAVMLAGATGGFAGGFVGTLLNGGDLGQAFKAGVVGGLVGGASGFLSFAAGSVTSKGITAIIERAAKHAFAEAWMSGIQGQNIFHGMISGALSSVGNGFINSEVNGLALKMASSAVLGGTISEIGGGKFANGAVTGAYSMLFNDIQHDLMEERAKKALPMLEDGIRKVLATAKSGIKISSKDLVKNYGVPKKAAALINSFTVNNSSSIAVDWNGWTTPGVELVSNARFKDGIMNIQSVSFQKTWGDFSVNNPLYITGGAIGLHVNGSTFWNIFVDGNKASIYKDFKKYSDIAP